jgi:hypothetical protein
LPQKSWNVYGQRNRQKVAEDEAERDAKEAVNQGKRDQADRERRLHRLRQEDGEVCCSVLILPSKQGKVAVRLRV